MPIRQLQSDVNSREEAELRRLEGASQVGGDEAAQPQQEGGARALQQDGGAIVSGAVHRGEQLSSKLFVNGGFRDSLELPGDLVWPLEIRFRNLSMSH